jgi:polysaccharide biosynthesis/export protein
MAQSLAFLKTKISTMKHFGFRIFFYTFFTLSSVIFSGHSLQAQLSKALPQVDQLSDDQVREFFEKAKSSGMTEAQIEQMAIARGYTAADVAKMRMRLNSLPQAASPKPGGNSSGAGQSPSANNPSGALPSQGTNTTIGRQQEGEVNEKAEVQVKATESLDRAKKTEIFGARMFSNPSMTFEPNLRLPTPRNYILGPDDELIVDISGNNFDNYRLRVSSEGQVKILNLPPIYVNGRTVEQAETIIINRLRQLYGGVNQPGSGTFANVSLGNVRSIKITITGNATRPGTFTVSSLATLFNALYLSGGPNENGSYRNIKLIRDNKTVKSVDLYDFLLRADQSDNVRLFDQDVIFIPDYETRVDLNGELKRPAIYEVQKGENLKTVFRYAGGFTDQAYTYTITVKRNTPKEQRILNLNKEEIENFMPQSGDKYYVGTILKRFENRVVIEGAVFRPGDYAIEDGLRTVKDLIQKAEGLREDAFQARATLIREGANLDQTAISFDLGKLMKGEVADIPLQRQDSLLIRSVDQLRERRTLIIGGAINRPGRYEFIEKMNIADLILLAGGFSESALPTKIEIARRIKQDTTGIPADQNVRIINIGVDEKLTINDKDKSYQLEPFDIINVRSSPRFEPQRLVTISGEVVFPGRFAILDRTERLSDLLKKAGGLKNGAFPKGAQLLRGNALVAINLEKATVDPTSNDNLVLVEGDELIVPRIQETVRLAGEVINPLSVAYNSKFTLKDYVSTAGGFSDKAQRKLTYVTYANGSNDYTRSFLFFRKYPKIEPGSTISVPAVTKDSNRLSPAERIAMLSAVGTFSIALVSIVNILGRTQ